MIDDWLALPIAQILNKKKKKNVFTDAIHEMRAYTREWVMCVYWCVTIKDRRGKQKSANGKHDEILIENLSHSRWASSRSEQKKMCQEKSNENTEKICGIAKGNREEKNEFIMKRWRVRATDHGIA